MAHIEHFQILEPLPSLRHWLSALGKEAEFLMSMGAVYVDHKRALGDQSLKTAQYVRVHSRPKRFNEFIPKGPIPLVADTPDFVIALKPRGLPTHPTLDNVQENLLALLQRQLRTSLYVTHRLDQMASGQVVLARSRPAQAKINRLFFKGQIEKIYQVFTKSGLPLGRHKHYMLKTALAPKKLAPEPSPNHQICEMAVLNSVPAQNPNNPFYLSSIRLYTGRTHQIRAQCAFLGGPIIGDALYGGGTPPEWPDEYTSSLMCIKLGLPHID